MKRTTTPAIPRTRATDNVSGWRHPRQAWHRQHRGGRLSGQERALELSLSAAYATWRQCCGCWRRRRAGPAHDAPRRSRPGVAALRLPRLTRLPEESRPTVSAYNAACDVDVTLATSPGP